jgi:hypothetical protein
MAERANDWRAAQHFRQERLPDGRTIGVVADHQYAILLWAALWQKTRTPAVLVSIDFHPDTDPPFWLASYQKAVARDPANAEAFTRKYSARLLAQIDPEDAESLLAQMPRMHNDEQITTAMALGYLADYHMINCMARHEYAAGHHYLVPEAHFGDLSDGMFAAAGFDLGALPQNRPLILDIDLDYFPDASGFAAAGPAFRALAARAGAFSMARSQTYFEYLRDPSAADFSMAACEAAGLALIREATAGGRSGEIKV